MKPWTVAALAVAGALYLTALSNDVYVLTSPATLSWHVALRKLYSIVAFSLVGYLADRGLREWGREANVAGCALGVALYSAAIEVGQGLHGSQEGLLWNAVDVACGAIGGILGTLALRAGSRSNEATRLRRARERPRR